MFFEDKETSLHIWLDTVANNNIGPSSQTFIQAQLQENAKRVSVIWVTAGRQGRWLYNSRGHHSHCIPSGMVSLEVGNKLVLVEGQSESVKISEVFWRNKEMPFSQKKLLANFSCKSQIVNMLGFAGHTVSVTATQLCYCRMKVARIKHINK